MFRRRLNRPISSESWRRPQLASGRQSTTDSGSLFGKVFRSWSTHAPAPHGKGLFITVLLAFMSSGLLFAQQRPESSRENRCGSYWANRIKNEAVMATTADEMQLIIDTYWSRGGTCDSWGHRWLAKWAVFAFGMKASELWDELSLDQQAQVEEILLDAINESTFYLGFRCGTRKGDTCSEDYVSMVTVLALVKNLFPYLVQSTIEIDALEEKYINLTFSDKHGYFGLVREQQPWDEQVEVKVYNHGEESPVYALYLLTGMGNAIFTYQIADKMAPQYYEHPNQLPLLRWIQSKTSADGFAFLSTCRRVNTEIVSCNDPRVSDTNPHVVPGGRFLGHAAQAGGYPFFEFDDSRAAGNYDIGRYFFYQVWNPKPYPLVRNFD